MNNQKMKKCRRAVRTGHLIQAFETRMLMSVSTTNWGGPLTSGTQWTYTLAGVEGVAGTTTTNVIGSATFNNHSTTEVDQSITVTQLGITNTNLIQEYDTLDSNGFVNYGSVASYGTVLGITIPPTTITNTPGLIEIPATMTQQSLVTETVSQAQLTGTISTSESVTETLKLESETPANRTVPAGTFSCYAIDVTSKDSTTGDNVSGYNGTVYYSPGVGLVEDDETSGTTQLASFNGVAPTAGKADHLVITAEPITVVPNATFEPAVTVQVDDALGNPVTSDASEVTLSLTPVTGTGTLAGTLTQPVVSGIATFAGLSIDSPGVYTLSATDGALTPEVGAPIAVSAATGLIAPSVSAGTLKTFLIAGSNETGSVTIALSNSSGATAKGSDTLQLYATDPNGKTSLVRTQKISTKVFSKGEATIKVPVRLLHLIEGTYQFSAEEIDAAKNAVFSTSGPIVTVAPKTVDVAGTIISVTPASALSGHSVEITLEVANSGNSLASGTIATAVGLSQTADGSSSTSVASSVHKVHILPGAHQLIRIRQKVPPHSVAGIYYWTINLNAAKVLSNSNTGNSLLVDPTPFAIITL